MKSNKHYLDIVSHYEACLENHGDSHLGVDWPNQTDAELRYRVMLDVITQASRGDIALLDFGCGASHLFEYIQQQKIDNIKYSGLDISAKFIALSESKYPTNDYYCLDILDTEIKLPEFDYVVLNGVFTEKRALSFEQMFDFTKAVMRQVFALAKQGVAFNVMSTFVDWERDDLFHLSLDLLAEFLTTELSRNFVIRNDYGLYEYSVYVYK